MGRSWHSGVRYDVRSRWGELKSDTVYSNKGGIGTPEQFVNLVYPFESVDLSKYLTEEELKEIQDKMPGTGYDNIKVM